MKMDAKAHGMDGSLVEPDWPPLTLRELRSVLTAFPAAGEPTNIITVSPRPFSAASVVATRLGQFFVKRHHRSVRDAEGLREEHQFIAHLRTHGAPAPKVLATISGESNFESREWIYEVHETPAGIDLYEDAISWTPFRSVEHAFSAGQLLARLHLAARKYDAPARRPRPLVAGFTIFAARDPERALKKYLGDRPALLADTATLRHGYEALEVLAPFHAELAPVLAALPPLWTHNDLHASNLFWSDRSDTAQATAVIDFGLSDRTSAVHDIAQAIERNIVEWLALVQDPELGKYVPMHLDHLHALLDGYESVRPLTAEEAAVLAPMTALCHAEFALTEADYFLGALHSKEKALLATDGYLVGHARWFRGAGGAKLLDAIRSWAATREIPVVRR